MFAALGTNTSFLVREADVTVEAGGVFSDVAVGINGIVTLSTVRWPLVLGQPRILITLDSLYWGVAGLGLTRGFAKKNV